ncbi:DUF927 domain-containing protein [Mesorhizobium yinganensis]|uniref:DUF927 domain-containing protein n=1 Tax=Mesorhizobium yinganensis TaxID=3157707 RepID=UPI0032B720AF
MAVRKITAHPRRLRKIVVDAAKKKQPCTVHPQRKSAQDTDEDSNPNDEAVSPKSIRVVAHMKNRDTGTFSTVLEFRDVQNAHTTIAIPRGTSSAQVRRELMDHGAVLSGEFDGEALVSSDAPVWEGSSRTGFHRDKKQFLMPCSSIGGGDNPLRFIPIGKLSSKRGRTKGSWRSWKRRLDEPLNCSSYMTLAVSCALAAPMLELTEVEETAAFNICGKSGAGKTLIEKVGESVLGPCNEKDLTSLNLTDRALNDKMFAANGMALFINELKNAEDRSGKLLTRLSHVLTSGNGLDRSAFAKRGNPDLEKFEWIVLGMTNREKSLEAMCGGKREMGERARHIDIPVPAPADGGIFDRRPRKQSATREMQRLVHKTRHAIDANYGSVFRRYIEFVFRHEDKCVEFFKTATDKFISDVVINDKDSWYCRFARKFGYVYAGGLLGIKAGLLPVDPATLFEMIRKLHSAALTMFEHPATAADNVVAKIYAEVRNRTMFPKIARGDGAPSGYDACHGFYRHGGVKGRMIAIKGDVFKTWCGSVEVRSLAVKKLKACGALMGGDSDAATTLVKIKGAGRRRYYLLDVKRLPVH